jgi:hypothetical protein
MTQKDTENKLLELLSYMIQDDARHFEKDTAKYIVSRLSTKSLMEPRRVHGIRNFYISSNIFGNVLLKNIFNINQNNYSVIEQWKEILAEKDPALIENPDILFSPDREHGIKFKNDTVIKSNFITYYAITNFKEWMANQNKEILGYSIQDIDTALITLESICEEQNSYFFIDNHSVDGVSKTAKQSEEFIKLIIKGKEEIIKNKWHDDKSFTNKLFNSKRMKSIMTDVDGEILSPLFSEESLGTIIRQANNFTTISENRHLFLNLSPLAPAEKWLEGFRKLTQKKYVDIVDLLNNKFNFAYGINLHLEYKSGLRKEGNSHPRYAKVFKEELQFLLPALSQMTLDKDQLCLLTNGIFRSSDVELMSIFLDSFDIPKLSANESEISQKIYNKMMFNMNDKIDLDLDLDYGDDNNEKFENWHQAIANIQAKKLDKKLPVNSELAIKRKLKI